MADSVNRIIPSTVAPERYPVLRRERDEKSKKEFRQQDADKPNAMPQSSAGDTASFAENDDGITAKTDKAKGKILDINA